MSKSSGLGDNFYCGGYDLSGDVASIDQTSGGPAVLDVTPIKAYANSVIGGIRQASVGFTTFWDASAGQEHVALSALPYTDTIATYFRGTGLGSPALSIRGKQIDYAPTRDNSGNLTMKTSITGDAYGMEWGIQLTNGLRTDTGVVTGAAYDTGQSWSNGCQAYLQIVAVTGGDVDITINQCATSGGSYDGLIDFGDTSSIGAFRQSYTGNIAEFLEVTTSGGFSSCTFAVMIVLNKVAVAF